VFQERAGRPIRKVCFESGKGNRSMTYIYTNIATCDSVSILYSSVVESPKRRKNVLLQYQSTAECRRNGWTHGRVWVLKRLYRDDAILLSLLLSSRIRRARTSLLPLCFVVVDGWMELVRITKGIDVRRPREREKAGREETGSASLSANRH
jgi:hypothetical protein